MRLTMKIFTTVIVFFLMIGLTTISSNAEESEDYPSKPIELIVCYSAGGDADLTARVWADFAEKKLGQPVTVVNKTGGGGVAGTTYAANQEADGYTLFLAQAGQNLIAPQTANTTYHWDSFDYLCRVMIGNCGLVVNADTPWQTMEEFVQEAKDDSRKITYASPGAVTWLTLTVRQLEMQAGIELKHVQFQGSAPAVTSVIGGHTDCTFTFPPNWVPQVKSGKARVLAVGKHSEQFPDVPTFNELGYKGNYVGWGGIAAPAGVPDYVKEKIVSTTKEIMQNDKFKKALNNAHLTPAFMGPDKWNKDLKKQNSQLSEIVESVK